MRKIAILGTGDTLKYFPNDGTWEIWSMNNAYLMLEKLNIKPDRWFELHVFKKERNKYIRRGKDYYGGEKVKKYMQDMAKLKIPVYMQKKWDIIPKSRIYPYGKIKSQFGDYFGCTFAYMLALAIYEDLTDANVETIGLWGVDLQGLEYFYQRPSTERLIGYAEGMGINIVIPEQSPLMKGDWIYAYAEDFDLINKMYVEHKSMLNVAAITYQQYLVQRMFE